MSDAGRLAVEVKGVTRVFPVMSMPWPASTSPCAYGETVAITGPSGCGKSTLLHLLAAIDSPTSGTVTVAGHDLAHLRDLSGYRRNEVGLVFQFHNLLPQLSALANVELPMFGTHRRRASGRSGPRELLAEVDLGGCEHRLPTELSGGERQRVAIARALANEPKILLADEPTGSLDSASTARFLELLERLGTRGMTIVMVTHASDVAAHAHRIVEMRDGTIVAGVTAGGGVDADPADARDREHRPTGPVAVRTAPPDAGAVPGIRSRPVRRARVRRPAESQNAMGIPILRVLARFLAAHWWAHSGVWITRRRLRSDSVGRSERVVGVGQRRRLPRDPHAHLVG